MIKNNFAVRLDQELTDWIKSKTSKHIKASDVIREALVQAMDEEKESNFIYKNSQKMTMTYYMLRQLIQTKFKNGNQIIDAAIANAIQDENNMLNPDLMSDVTAECLEEELL